MNLESREKDTEDEWVRGRWLAEATPEGPKKRGDGEQTVWCSRFHAVSLIPAELAKSVFAFRL